MPTNHSEFESIFAELRAILQKHSTRLVVTADSPGYYCLGVEFSPKLGKGYPVAWVKISKAYVSFHFMPVYMFPKLAAGLSKELRTRMQGKSCFNFKTRNAGLFEELARLTTTGLQACRDEGYAAMK
jgi:hypothetical protein